LQNSVATGTPLLEVQGLKAFYGRAEVLHSVDLTVARGEFVTIVGPNGAGKTTLLRAVMGLVQKDGTTRFDGVDVSRLSTIALARRGIIMVLEGRGLFPQMSVRENLILGAFMIAGQRAEVASRRERVLTLFPRLGERLDQMAGSMSGGEQQMLALGRALMAGPQLLLLDEPSLGLAPRVAEEIFAALGALNRDGVSILLVEQKAPLAIGLTKRAYVVVLGRIAAELPGEKIASHHDLAQYYLG
jgi:branched-chain amino acid transport system ATP-binding protein